MAGKRNSIGVFLWQLLVEDLLFTFVQQRQWSFDSCFAMYMEISHNICLGHPWRSKHMFKPYILLKCMAANNYVWPGPTTICWLSHFEPEHCVFSLWYSLFFIIYLHFNLGHSCTVVTCLCGALLDSSCTKCLCCTESILMRVGYYIKESDHSACLLITKSSVVSHCQFPEARSDL